MKSSFLFLSILPLAFANPAAQRGTPTKAPPSTASPWPTETPEPITCGGYTLNPRTCPQGQACVIPMDSPCRRGVTDCPGVCVGQVCGGYTFPPNGPCPRNQICVDHPETPLNSADIPGYCQLKDLTCKRPEDKGKTLGGRKDNKCPEDWLCKAGAPEKCDGNWPQKECGGVCVWARNLEMIPGLMYW